LGAPIPHSEEISQPRTVIEDGRAIGRMYEDRHAKAELRWFWSITVYVDPKQDITTSGRAATLDEAKAQSLSNWQRVGRSVMTGYPGYSTAIGLAASGNTNPTPEIPW
jgi:hypothetical protein